MKTHLWIGLGFLLVVSVAALSQFGSTLEVNTKVEKEVITEEVHPDWATDEDAVKAAQDVIRRKELEAEIQSLEDEMSTTYTEFHQKYGDLETRKTQLEKELGTY